MNLLNDIDKMIDDDPIWKKVCLLKSDSKDTCADDLDGNIAKVSPLTIFKLAFGDDFSELT
jgi:hypothetical protein